MFKYNYIIKKKLSLIGKMCTIKDSILLRDLPLCDSLIGELVCFYMSSNSNTSIINRKYSTDYKVNSFTFNFKDMILSKNHPLEDFTFESFFKEYIRMCLNEMN